MPAGLAILNDYGSVQIDENWKNWGFKQLIPMSVHIPASTNFLANVYSLSVAGDAVLIAPVSQNLAVSVVRTEYSGGVWTYHFIILRQFILSYEETETAYIYVFDAMPGSSFSNVGLEVFNALGQRVFHSDMNPLKARAVLPGSSGFSGTSGRTYAPLALTHTRHFDPVNGIQYWGLRSFGSYITAMEHNVAGGGFAGTSVNDGLYAAVDVTGLS
jgi:hypothetical protein